MDGERCRWAWAAALSWRAVGRRARWIAAYVVRAVPASAVAAAAIDWWHAHH